MIVTSFLLCNCTDSSASGVVSGILIGNISSADWELINDCISAQSNNGKLYGCRCLFVDDKTCLACVLQLQLSHPKRVLRIWVDFQ